MVIVVILCIAIVYCIGFVSGGVFSVKSRLKNDITLALVAFNSIDKKPVKTKKILCCQILGKSRVLVRIMHNPLWVCAYSANAPTDEVYMQRIDEIKKMETNLLKWATTNEGTALVHEMLPSELIP